MSKSCKPLHPGLFLLGAATAALVFAAPQTCVEALQQGLALCGGPLLVSLFPFLVVSALIMRSGAGEVLGVLLWPVVRCIGLRSRSAGSVLLIGLVGGFAPAAAATAEAVRSRKLTSQEASALLPACICSGPSFVILTVGEQLLGSRTAGVCLFAAQVLAGWLTAALVLVSVDTAALVAGLVTAFEASSILDVVFHGLLLWYLAMGVRRGREAMEEPEGQRETPEPLPQNTEFYDASMGDRPNSPSLGQPAEGKHRTLLTAAYGSQEIEVRRSYGLTALSVDGRVYGRQEGVVETGYTIRARVSGHDVETEFTPTGKQLLRVDGQVIARKQRLF